MTSPILKVTELFKAVRKRTILKDISFQVKPGEVVALLGPNGAGKTTCFHATVGLVEADGGKISLGGQDMTHWPVYRRARAGLGYLPQEPSIFRGLTVEENIRAVLEVVAPDHRVLNEKLASLLEEFGLRRVRTSPGPALSGGERRRVEIARALASNPKFMLLDEPFAGVDPIAVNDMRVLVRKLAKKSLGVLMTDHNVQETLNLVDRAYIIHDGRVMMHGTPEEIVANKDVRRVYLGDTFRLDRTEPKEETKPS